MAVMKRQFLIILSFAVVSFLLGTLVRMGLTAGDIVSNPFDRQVSETSELARGQECHGSMRRDLYQVSREYGINLSKLLESSLIQLLDTEAEPFSLVKVSFREKKSSVAGPRGIEPLTYGLRVRRSNLAELRAHGGASHIAHLG